MSTKIYDGLRATDFNPFDVAKNIRAVMEPIFHEEFTNHLKLAQSREGETWGRVFDLPHTPYYAKWVDKVIKFKPWDTTDDLHELLELLQHSKVHTFSSLDFGYEVGLFKNITPGDTRPLILIYAERLKYKYIDALKEQHVVTEYGYWNNTDQPDELTEAEWKEREKAWDAFDIPAHAGLFFNHPSAFDVSWYNHKHLFSKLE